MSGSGAPGGPPGSRGLAHDGTPGRAASLLLILAFSLIPRLIELPKFRPDTMDADSAHFLNIARCFERGQGFSNPAAWPAWIQPARLPMPETFKEPGYPWLIAQATRAGRDPFRAGQAISLVAGLLLPLVIWLLARQAFADPLVALLAALIAAGSPLLADKSVSVLVESLFALTIALSFLCAAWGMRAASRENRGIGLDAMGGALVGASYLLRAQTLLALPALVLLMARGRSPRRTFSGLLIAASFALLVMSPLIARNLRLFGVPFYSDVTAYGLWPYVDHITFSHGLEHPGSPLAFALAHPGAVAAHTLWSIGVFTKWALPRELYGDPLWMLALGIGIVALWPSRRDWGFAALYGGVTVGFILAVNWATYYFTSSMWTWCLLAGAGAAWSARALDLRRTRAAAAGGRAAPRALAVPAVLALALIGPLVVAFTRPALLARQVEPELAAARHEAPFLRERLTPDEAVMAKTTSYWAWFTDRPAVHFVVADSVRFMETVRRLNVRWAALPTSGLDTLASRCPGGRLPAALSIDHADPDRDVTVFRVIDPGRGAKR